MAEPMSKRHESGREVMASDRISDLPDSLLLHILSFLPTKEAVATCLLSKRWRPLWLLLSNLDIDDYSFGSFDFFSQFVDTVLILGDPKPVKKFCLRCGYIGMPLPRINRWINAAINCKVEHLELRETAYMFNIDMPSRIFNCITISILKLSGVTVNTPSSVSLPSVKVLHLDTVRFPNSKCVANLISGCPLLEDLVLKHWDMPNYHSTPNIERLINLVSAKVLPFLITLKAFSNVTVLQINTINWHPSHDIPTFYNLSHLEFTCYFHDWNTIMKCLQNCPKLEILVIHQFLCWGRLMEPMLDVPQCLSSHLKKFYLGHYKDWENEFELARFIMNNARGLRTISISSISSKVFMKAKMLKRLSSCYRISADCWLLFS